MAIKIKQHDDEWRIIIDLEEWKFNTRQEMEAGLKVLLDLKENNGQIKYMDVISFSPMQPKKTIGENRLD
jgi:hypothetical protein